MRLALVKEKGKGHKLGQEWGRWWALVKGLVLETTLLALGLESLLEMELGLLWGVGWARLRGTEWDPELGVQLGKKWEGETVLVWASLWGETLGLVLGPLKGTELVQLLAQQLGKLSVGKLVQELASAKGVKLALVLVAVLARVLVFQWVCTTV
jgi:hypothetical protein